jgi:peptidoglycan/LPS O-acetylase OafA/YrhL
MKLTWLTWLRGLAALVVVFYHLNQHRSTVGLTELSWDFYQFTEHLVFVVSIFFVFSGFFRSLSYWKTWNVDSLVPKFFPSLRERFFRIAPVYYFSLILTFLLVVFWNGWTFEGFVRLLSGFTFLSWISPVTFFPVDENGPLWFISYDMLGWIGISILMMYIITLRKIWHIIWAFIVTWICLIGLHFLWISFPWRYTSWVAGEWFPIYNPFLFGLHFLVGAILGGIIEYMKRCAFTKKIIFDFVGILSFFFLGYFLWQIRESGDWDYSWPHGPYHFPFTMVGIVWLIISLPYSRYLGKFLDNQIFLFIAKISYTLYIFHALVIVMLRKYVFTDIQLWWMSWGLLSIIVLFFSILIAWWTHRYIENHEWIKK